MALELPEKLHRVVADPFCFPRFRRPPDRTSRRNRHRDSRRGQHPCLRPENCPEAYRDPRDPSKSRKRPPFACLYKNRRAGPRDRFLSRADHEFLRRRPNKKHCPLPGYSVTPVFRWGRTDLAHSLFRNRPRKAPKLLEESLRLAPIPLFHYYAATPAIIP